MPLLDVLVWVGSIVAGDGIGLDEAVRLAQAHAPPVQVAQAESLEASKGIAAAGVLPNPQLSAATIRNSYNFVAGIQLPLVIFGQRALAMRASEGRLYERQSAQTQISLLARQQVTQIWINLWLSEKNLDIRTQTQARYDRLYQMTQQRYDDGASSEVEVIRARAAAARAAAEQAASAALVDAAAAQLHGFLAPNTPLSLPLQTQGEPPGMVTPPSCKPSGLSSKRILR